MLNIHFKCLSNHDIQTVSKIFLSATNARVKSIFAGNRHNIMDLNWSNKNANDEELGLLLPPFYSLPPGQVGMNAALQSKINIHHQTMPIQSGLCVCARAFVGRVRAYFTQNQPTNPACFQKVWARGASPLPSPPATTGFQGSPVSQYFLGGYLIPFFWVSLALFGPPSCRCCFWDAPILLPLSPVMSSLLREEMQRVLFRPAKERLVEFIEIEEPSNGRHFFCASGKQLDCWLRNMRLIFTQE